IFDYGEPVAMTLGGAAPYIAIVAALLVISAVGWFKRPLLGFLGVWFFFTLAPTSSVVPIATEVGADRRMYLPLAALVVLAVVLLYLLREQWAHAAPNNARGMRRQVVDVASLTIVGVVCFSLALTTVRRHRDYASGLTLWQTVLD